MFGRPKHVPAKAVAKPAAGMESIKVRGELEKKYPQMSEADWGKPKKKAKPATESVAAAVRKAEAGKKSALEGALTADEIKKLQGK